MAVFSATLAAATQAAEPPLPSRAPAVILDSQQRQQIRSLPIEQRPYRPLHVYGNTVRRRHYRAAQLPEPNTRALVPPQRR